MNAGGAVSEIMSERCVVAFFLERKSSCRGRSACHRLFICRPLIVVGDQLTRFVEKFNCWIWQCIREAIVRKGGTCASEQGVHVQAGNLCYQTADDRVFSRAAHGAAGKIRQV